MNFNIVVCICSLIVVVNSFKFLPNIFAHGVSQDTSMQSTQTHQTLSRLNRLCSPVRDVRLNGGERESAEYPPIWVNSTVPILSDHVLNDQVVFRPTMLPNNPPECIEIRKATSCKLLASRYEDEPQREEHSCTGCDTPDFCKNAPATGQLVGKFVEMFRSAAPYIRRHHGNIMVIHIPSALLGTHVLDSTMSDVCLMALLGVKIVIVIGVRSLVDKKLDQIGLSPQYIGNTRVTDEKTLTVIKEMAGFARFEIESRLARSIMVGDANQISVVGGNFYSAQPIGVRGGIDFGYTGKVRRFEKESMELRLNSGDIIVLTCLGYSASGELFNVNSEHLAAQAAGQLSASKVIYITEGEQMIDKRTGELVQSMRVKDTEAFLKYHGLNLNGDVDFQGATNENEAHFGTRPFAEHHGLISMLRGCAEALKKGAMRAHLIGPHPGTLIQECYTRDGAGTLIAKDLYDDIRPATIQDIPGIQSLIRPLEESGYLVPRSTQELEKDIDHLHVFVRDGCVVAVAMIKPYDEVYGEIGCFAVSPKYRKAGRGDAMLTYLERIAIQMGIKRLFCLSTQTMQWFMERGFIPVRVEALPPSRLEKYNWQRNARVYMKDVMQARALDEEELFMNINRDD